MGLKLQTSAATAGLAESWVARHLDSELTVAIPHCPVSDHLQACCLTLNDHLCAWGCAGMGMTDMGSDAFNFGKNLAIMIGQNFPERVSRSVAMSAMF